MPVRRAGYERFMRNVLIAAGNSKDTALVPLIMPYLESDFPLVQSMAVWALSCLISQDALRALYQPSEQADVMAEWQRALGSLLPEA